MSLRRNPDRRVRQRTEETNNNNNEVNNNNGPPPPPPPLILPPAGNNDNNNQAAIADELAAAGAADAAGAAAPVDPFAASVAQLNADRPIVSLLRDARNGNGESISEAAQNKGRVDLNSQRLFHISQLGIFGKVRERTNNGGIKLKCLYSSSISGGNCNAIIHIPVGGNGMPDYANFLNWIGLNAIGGDRSHFHSDDCPCRTNPNLHLHQQLNIQNHLMTDLNINAPASVVLPNIGNFGISQLPWECLELDLNALASLINQSSRANKNLSTLMYKKWSSSLGVLFEAIVTSFTNGTLGCSMNDNLHQVIKKLLGQVDNKSMYKNMPLELRSFAGLMQNTTKALLWDLTDNSMIESYAQALEIKRETCRVLLSLLLRFIKDCGVTIPLESLPIDLFPPDRQNPRRLLSVGDVMIHPHLFRPNMQELVSRVDLLGDDQASFLELVGSSVAPDQLSQLQNGNWDEVTLPNMLQALLHPRGESFRARAPNPNAGSREIFYIIEIVNFFMRGGFTGVAPKATLGSVLRALLGRGNGCKISQLLFKSRLRGVSGQCSYHAQGHDNETMWKAFILLLEKRADFMEALGNGITETANDQEEEEEGAVVPLPPLGDVLTAENWVISTCTETGLQFYYNTETQAGQWNRPEPGEQQAE